VDGSIAVWNALGLNTDDGVVPITWTMAWNWMNYGASSLCKDIMNN
jgi:hypothetical protein